ncbi:hypothetical protein ACO22_05886, partial [Paracoccidioides brasiliensis]
ESRWLVEKAVTSTPRDARGWIHWCDTLNFQELEESLFFALGLLCWQTETRE